MKTQVEYLKEVQDAEFLQWLASRMTIVYREKPKEYIVERVQKIVAKVRLADVKIGQYHTGTVPVVAKSVTTSIDPEIISCLDIQADKRRVSRAELIRQILTNVADDNLFTSVLDN